MVDSLTTDQAKRIADLPKQSARLKLAKYLKWKMDEFDEELNMRESILLDYYYDNIIFAVNQGFPWSQVCEIFQLSKEIHKETKGLALLDAIKLYTIISQKYSSTVGENNLKIFTTYFFQTFMQHYKLYQFVFTNEREPMITQYKLHVNTPSECLPFKQGKEFLVWDYEKKIHDMEVKDREKKEEILKKRADLFSLKDQVLQGPFQEVDADTTLAREEIEKLIDEATLAHSMITQKNIETRIEEKHESLDYMFEKMALPRPAAMGPPPRIKSPTRSSAKSRQSTRGGNKTALSDSVKSRAQSKSSLRGKTPKT